MNEIIKELCEIEERAGQIMKNTESQKQEIQKKKKAEEEFTIQELQGEIEGRLTILKSGLNEQAEQEIQHVIQKNESMIAELNQKYDENYEMIALKILERIIEV